MTLAVLFRLWDLPSLPPACWYDEAENGLATLGLLKRNFLLFTPGRHGALLYYWSAPFFCFLEPSIFILRLATAFIGILTVAAAWMLFRQLLNTQSALIATFLLAVSFWHVLVSRIAFVAIVTPFFDILVLLTILHAARARSLYWAALPGILTGLANYGYSASRITLLLLAAGSLIFYAADRNLRFPKTLIGLFAALIMLLPLGFYAFGHSRDFAQRTKEVSVVRDVIDSRSAGPVLRNIRAYARMFWERGDKNPRHNIPGRAALDPLTGLFFAAGLLWALVSRRPQPGKTWPSTVPGVSPGAAQRMMLWWMLLYLAFAGIMTDTAPHNLRTLSLVVPACFFAAQGFQFIFSTMRFPPRIGPAVMVGLLLTAGFLTGQAYFRVYATYPGLRNAFSPVAHAAGKYLGQHPNLTSVVLSPSISRSVVRFIANNPSLQVSNLPAPDSVASETENTNAAPSPPQVHATIYFFRSMAEAEQYLNIKEFQWQEIQTRFKESFFILRGKLP